MHGFYALLSLLMLSNASLFGMQLTRIIKTGSRSVLTNHKQTQKQILRTISSDIPQEQQLLKSCSKPEDCICIKPFMPNSTVEYCKDNNWEHKKALERLDNTIRYFEHSNDTQTLQKLTDTKKQLCPNTEICYQMIGRHFMRRIFRPTTTITAITACVGIATANEFYLLIVPVVGIISLFVVSRITENPEDKVTLAISKHRSNEITLITKTFKELKINIPLRDINIVYDNDKDTWL